MQLTLIAGGYYLLEPDLCRSRNISGVSTWISNATVKTLRLSGQAEGRNYLVLKEVVFAYVRT